MAIQLQNRRGTASQWTSSNPTLASGEIGYETDTGKFKIGNGSTTWAQLSYAGGIDSLTRSGGTTTVSENLSISGNLTVLGTTTTINSTQIDVQNALVFEGLTDNTKETTLTVEDPTTDRTITLPDATGTVVLEDASQTLTNKTISGGSLGGTITAYGGTIAGPTLSGGTLNGVTLSSAVLQTSVLDSFESLGGPFYYLADSMWQVAQGQPYAATLYTYDPSFNYLQVKWNSSYNPAGGTLWVANWNSLQGTISNSTGVSSGGIAVSGWAYNQGDSYITINIGNLQMLTSVNFSDKSQVVYFLADSTGSPITQPFRFIPGSTSTFISGSTITSPTISGTITASNATIVSPTVSGGFLIDSTLSGTVQAYSATINSPTLSGGTIQGSTLSGTVQAYSATINSPTLSGGTIQGSTLSGTVQAYSATIVSPTVSGLSGTFDAVSLNSGRTLTNGGTISGGTLLSPTISGTINFTGATVVGLPGADEIKIIMGAY